jgi:ATP-grasp ribosomal peptide maturase
VAVLILADERDVAADRVVLALRERAAVVHRVDTAWFPTQLSFHAELGGTGWVGQLRTPGRVVDLAEVHAICHRRPAAFRFPRRLSNVERQHAQIEAQLGLGGVLAGLDVLWVNHPSRVADAVYQPVQLVLAARCGLAVPDTLITSEAAAVRRFVGYTNQLTVTKALGAATISEEGTHKVAFPRRVHPHELGDLAGIEVTAHQFQRWVPKAFDARVVAVGRRQYAFAIHDGGPAARLDLRRDRGALRCERIGVPTAVRDGIGRFMAASGLRYSTLDFAVTPDGEWVFLANNPEGDHGWLETRTGTPVTAALADLLAGADHR